MTQFDYRLTETIYTNRVEWEDGPGSLQNIVADKSAPRVMCEWQKKDEAFGKNLMRFHMLDLPDDSPDGHVEYSHMLERRPSGMAEGAWNFVGFLYPREDDIEE